MNLERRKWTPDVNAIADQLIESYRDVPSPQGDIDALSTIESWQSTAAFHGEEFTEDDWMALVQKLARRAADISN